MLRLSAQFGVTLIAAAEGAVMFLQDFNCLHEQHVAASAAAAAFGKWSK